jgi:hypothetical protein
MPATVRPLTHVVVVLPPTSGVVVLTTAVVVAGVVLSVDVVTMRPAPINSVTYVSLGFLIVLSLIFFGFFS